MNEQETIKDIIAEMLGARVEFPFVYLMGEPDTPEVIDPKTKEIIAPRKINIRRVTVRELAFRVAAAYKREVGNFAALREALIRVLRWLKRMNAEPLNTLAVSELTPSYAVNRTAKSIIEDNDYHISQLTDALSAPPRNCDRPLVVEGPADNNADKAWLVFKRHHPDAYFDVPGLLRCIDWLLAPAREGGAK